MTSETSVPYAVYELYPKHYVILPERSIRCCPECGGALSKSDLPPSRTVTSWLSTATMPYHNFTHLYECTACGWWAVWESFGDAEYSPDFHFLIASRRNGDPQLPGQPWNQVLQKEDLFDHDLPLPGSLARVIQGGKRRVLDLPRPGDRVRLIGEVQMIRDPEALPFEWVPLWIAGSEGVVAGDDELYLLIKVDDELYELIKDQPMEPEFTRNLLIRLKANLEARNCSPIRLEKLVVSPGRKSSVSCQEGRIYIIDAADVQKLD